MIYAELKEAIVLYSGLEKDALHIHGALLIYVVAMGVFRQSRRSRVPWLTVLGAELLNEVLDLSGGLRGGGDTGAALAETAKDLWNTMLWPTVLLFVGRYTDWLQKKPRHTREVNCPL